MKFGVAFEVIMEYFQQFDVNPVYVEVVRKLRHCSMYTIVPVAPRTFHYSSLSMFQYIPEQHGPSKA